MKKYYLHAAFVVLAVVFLASAFAQNESVIQEELESLVYDVFLLNLHEGISNSLDTKLDAALNALDDVNENNDVAAINSLAAFINAVEAQRGNKISVDDADYLIFVANNIIVLLTEPSDCSCGYDYCGCWPDGCDCVWGCVPPCGGGSGL